MSLKFVHFRNKALGSNLIHHVQYSTVLTSERSQIVSFIQVQAFSSLPIPQFFRKARQEVFVVCVCYVTSLIKGGHTWKVLKVFVRC